MCALQDEKEIKNERSEIQRLMEELRAAKEENMKKIGEVLILKYEWKRARRERMLLAEL